MIYVHNLKFFTDRISAFINFPKAMWSSFKNTIILAKT